MPTQIIDDGASLKIVTNGSTKVVQKSNIKTVEVLVNFMIKIDIGKDPLHNIYISQPVVDNPVSTDPNNLRDLIEAMLQPVAGQSGSTATAANQMMQMFELQNINNSVINMTSALKTMDEKVMMEPKLIDETQGRVIYKGYAMPGSDENGNVWAIQRVTNDENILSFHWALGTKNFDKRWSYRAEYQYS